MIPIRHRSYLLQSRDAFYCLCSKDRVVYLRS
jgi:hypothetical protein